MNRAPVQSSQIRSIGYDEACQLLEIEFHPRTNSPEGTPGPVYQYSNFTVDDWRDFLGAASKGSHFIRIIKANPTKWPYRRASA